MIRREDLIEAMGMPDEGFDRAVDAALRSVRAKEETPVMKRKLTLTLLAAAVAVVMLTGAALAMGFNLFDWFGEHDQRLRMVAPEAAKSDQASLRITTEALGDSEVRIDSAYYDGQSLIVAFAVRNPHRLDPFVPTDTELQAMRPSEDIAARLADMPPGYDDLRRAVERGEPYGMAEYTLDAPDRGFTVDGVELPPYVSAIADDADDTANCIVEFATPLPDAIRDRESLTLHMDLALFTSRFWFDGSRWYESHGQQPVGQLTATVRRAEAETRTYAWEGTLNGAKVHAEAQVSAVHADLRIEAGDGAFPTPKTLWPEVAEADDTWYVFGLSDPRGMDYRFSGGLEGEGVLETEYDGVGYLPDEITFTVFLEGEGDWDADAHVLPGCPVTLEPVG